MAVYRLLPRPPAITLRPFLVALAWTAGFAAGSAASVWLAIHWPASLGRAAPFVRPMVWMLALNCAVLAVASLAGTLLRVFRVPIRPSATRDAFELTVTPEGVRRRAANTREPDVWLSRADIVGFTEMWGGLWLRTTISGRRLLVPFDLDAFDACREELTAFGIQRLPADSLRRSFGYLVAFLAGGALFFGGLHNRSAATALSGVAVWLVPFAGLVWMQRRNPDRLPRRSVAVIAGSWAITCLVPFALVEWDKDTARSRGVALLLIAIYLAALAISWTIQRRAAQGRRAHTSC